MSTRLANRDKQFTNLLKVCCHYPLINYLGYILESHGDWFAIDHGSNLSKNLQKAFKIRGI